MVKLIQLLCPARHCILATAFEDPHRESSTLEAAELVTFQLQFAKLVKTGALQAHCGICGSGDLRFEVRVTKFQTMFQVQPHLDRCEVDQLVSRSILDAAGLTHDQQKKN